ncbi:MAG: Rrf2 family transcriptional regulator [Candidatus Marinimicrobia bacterium]|jgi:Rrf2 family protein|nr:Rrf2 family transcriptional regulator [Candidatus Neomarinimicrobiota bacterium]
MSISKAADYAILTVAYLATVSRESNNLRSKVYLSSRLNLPKEFLSLILQKLTRSKILTSKRGVTGGYFLTKDADEITFKDVIEAVDGKKALVECISDDFEHCNRLHICKSIIPKMKIVQERVDDALDSMHFGELDLSQLSKDINKTKTSNS